MVTSILDDWHFGSYTVPVEQRVLARFALLVRGYLCALARSL